MLKIRFNPTIGILFAAAGIGVFGIFGWFALNDDRWEYWLIAIAGANLAIGYLSFSTAHIVLEPDAVVVRNRFGKTLAKYPLDPTGWVELDDDSFYITKGSLKTKLAGITKGNCNGADWESFREIVSKKKTKAPLTHHGVN